MRTRMNRSVPLSSRIDVEYCDKLEEMADREQSTISGFVSKIVRKYIDENWEDNNTEE